MTSPRLTAAGEDDIMAVQQLREDVEDEDFAKDWHEPVQINLGPNVGDITTGRKPAYVGRVNFISNSRVLKPKKIDEGLRPVVGLRLVAVNRHLYVNLYCKIGIRRDQLGYEYEPVLGLCEPTGVYI